MKKAFDEGWGAVIAKTVSLDSSKARLARVLLGKVCLPCYAADLTELCKRRTSHPLSVLCSIMSACRCAMHAQLSSEDCALLRLSMSRLGTRA